MGKDARVSVSSLVGVCVLLVKTRYQLMGILGFRVGFSW